MESKQWLIIQLYDERYDFNLHIKTFEGTIEELANNECLDVSGFKSYRDGWYEYRSVDRKEIDKYFDEELAATNMLEKVEFETVLCKPLNEINWNDLYFEHPVVSRNMKFGFLDIKK